MIILENKEEYLKDFIRLNEEWISKYFKIESADKELSKNPKKIMDDGGYVFCLMIDQKVIGVCALFNEGGGIYELARMAVSQEHQGKKYGDHLIKNCLNKLKELNARKVYLVSNTKLNAAISLYKKYGFITIFEGQHPLYARGNIVMELEITSI